MNIAICDDEQYFASDLKMRIEACEINTKKEICINVYNTSCEILKAAESIKFDIVFMDIELENGIRGYNVADIIKNRYTDCLLIYISAYNYYEPLAQHEPFKFICKPVQSKDIESALSAAYNRLSFNSSRYSFTFRGVQHIIQPSQIVYAYSTGRSCNLVMQSGQTYQFYKKLADLEAELDKLYPRFIRIGKSYLVNYDHVVRINHRHVTMDTGEMLNLSRKYIINILKID